MFTSHKFRHFVFLVCLFTSIFVIDSFLPKSNQVLNIAVWPAIIGAVGSIAGSLLGMSSSNGMNKRAERMQRETNELNYRIFQEQNQNTLNLWNLDNEYNTPENQRQRLEDAGMNPLFYGLDGNTSNSMPQLASAPQMQNPQLDMQTIPLMLMNGVANISKVFQESELLSAQKKLIESNVRGNDADTDLKKQTLHWNEVLNGDIHELNGVKLNLDASQIHLNEAQVRNVESSITSTTQQLQMMREQLDFSKITWLDDFQLRKQMHEFNMSMEEQKFTRDFYIALRNLYNSDRLTTSQVNVNNASAIHITKQGDLLDFEIQFYNDNPNAKSFEHNAQQMNGLIGSAWNMINKTTNGDFVWGDPNNIVDGISKKFSQLGNLWNRFFR